MRSSIQEASTLCFPIFLHPRLTVCWVNSCSYALRLCAQTGKFWSQAELSFAMGMYETAIQLLLSPQVRSIPGQSPGVEREATE